MRDCEVILLLLIYCVYVYIFNEMMNSDIRYKPRHFLDSAVFFTNFHLSVFDSIHLVSSETAAIPNKILLETIMLII